MTDATLLSKSDRTSRAILDSAYHLFAAQGYAATSMRQIAEGAGLALGSIYNHFSSKEDIFEAIVLKRHPVYSILPLLEQAPGETLDEYIRNAAHLMVAELRDHPEFLNLILIEMVEFKARHAPLLLEKISPEALVIASRMTVFQPGVRALPQPLLLRAFIGMFFSYFITGMIFDVYISPEQQETALDRFVDIFLYGIKQSVNAEQVHAARNLKTPETL